MSSEKKETGELKEYTLEIAATVSCSEFEVDVKSRVRNRFPPNCQFIATTSIARENGYCGQNDCQISEEFCGSCGLCSIGCTGDLCSKCGSIGIRHLKVSQIS